MPVDDAPLKGNHAGNTQAVFDFAARQKIIEEAKANRIAEAERLSNARKETVEALFPALVSYLQTIGIRPHQQARTDTGFQIVALNTTVTVSIDEDLTFRWKGVSGSGVGSQITTGKNLSRDEITDALIVFFRPDL